MGGARIAAIWPGVLMPFANVRKYLTFPVLIERPTVGTGFSQETTWAALATVDGYLWALSGGESIDYGGDNVRSTHRLIVAPADIAEADRVTIASKTYLVRYVDTKQLYGESWLQIDLEYVGATA